jgi:hypothetical protein
MASYLNKKNLYMATVLDANEDIGLLSRIMNT